MAPKIFITGVTGYIAGDAFHVLHQTHPDYEYTALVRTQEKADRVLAAYPNIRIALGDLDDATLLESEAAKADIVLHAADASDHVDAANAIARGLARGHTAARPGYWLHTGGTGILTYFDSRDEKLGERSDKEFNDGAGVVELTGLPDEAFHREVDRIVLAAGEEAAGKVKTAIVCPPTIYGQGRGPVSTRGRQVYELTKLILQKGYAPIVGQGLARWNHVHVHDLSDVYLRLVEAAAAGNGDAEIWGARGYFLTEQGEHVWGELARFIARTAAEMGLIATDWKDYALDKEEALQVAGFEAVSWGLNSRGKAERATRVLGWKPVGASLEDEVPNILQQEKERLG